MDGGGAGEFPDQPAIYGAADQVAGIGGSLRAFDILEDPAEFRAGKVGCQRQAAFR